MFAEEVVELVGTNQVSGWLVYQDEFWQEVKVGEFAPFSHHDSEIATLAV